MGLPDPKRAQELLLQHRADEKSKKREAAQRIAWELELAREAESFANSVIDAALPVAAKGEELLKIQSSPNMDARKLLTNRGFRFMTAEDKAQFAENGLPGEFWDPFAQAVADYARLLKGLKANLCVWISVHLGSRHGGMPAEELIRKIQTRMLPLMLGRVEADLQTRNWVRVVSALREWKALCEDWIGQGKKSSFYDQLDIANFAEQGKDSVELAILTEDMTLNSARVQSIASFIESALAKAYLARTTFPDIATLERGMRAIKADDDPESTKAVLFWALPPEGDSERRDEINAWILSWLASASGQKFLEEIDLSITAASRAGESALRIAKAEIESDAELQPTLGEIACVMRGLGFKATAIDEGVEVRWND
jgi:hypothetical protein